LTDVKKLRLTVYLSNWQCHPLDQDPQVYPIQSGNKKTNRRLKYHPFIGTSHQQPNKTSNNPKTTLQVLSQLVSNRTEQNQ
jgi:hypothetical protein